MAKKIIISVCVSFLVAMVVFFSFGQKNAYTIPVSKFYSYPEVVQKAFIAAGLIEQFTYINKFGHNADIDTGTDPEDIWSGSGEYVFSTTAAINTVSSSDATDTQNACYIGLDADWLEVLQCKDLNGQNKVTLDTPLIRFFRGYNNGSTDFTGSVYIYEDTPITNGVPDDATKTRGVIMNGDNQTEMAIYTIPADKVGYFLGGYVGIDRTGSRAATFTWRARPFGGVFQVKGRITNNSDGSSFWTYEYPIPEYVPPKTDIIIKVEEVSANNTGAVGGFTLLLEQTIWSSE